MLYAMFRGNVTDRIRGFLSLRKLVKTDVLVVEGWLWDSLLRKAVDFYLEGGYRLIIVAGAYSKASLNACSKATARRLAAMGIPREAIKVAEARFSRFHHTAAAGRALKGWLADHPSITAVNVVTYGSHARKTYVIFKRMLPKTMRIGIFPITSVSGGKVKRRRRAFGRFSPRGALHVLRSFAGCVYAALWPFS